jgi:hypothetical protein
MVWIERRVPTTMALTPSQEKLFFSACSSIPGNNDEVSLASRLGAKESFNAG